MLLNKTSQCIRISCYKLYGRSLSLHASWRDTVDSKNPTVNALVHTSQSIRNHEHAAGPLPDVSVAIKDNICTAELPTTCSSLMLKTFKSPFDATVVRLLYEAKAEIVGKANCDEFGMGYVSSSNVRDI